MLRSVALLLTVLTGFSGLVYEVSWQKYLASLLGSDSEATAAVLSIFLAGLAVGYSLFGAVSRRLVARARAAGRRPPLLLTYGVVEIAIGLYVFVFPELFEVVRGFSAVVPPDAAVVSFAFDVALAVLLIGPPTVLMGGTIPLLTQGLARGLDDATRIHAFVYAFNTVGAFAGALAAGFYLIPSFGLVRVMAMMGAINVAAGILYAGMGFLIRSDVPAEAPKPGAPVSTTSYAAVAWCVGFSMIVFQTILIRVGGLSFGSSQFTFSMVVAVFVLCIALGSFGVSAFTRIPRALLVVNQWSLVALMVGVYGVLQDAPYWAHVLRTLFRDQSASFYPFYGAAFLGVLVLAGPPIVLSGATLPLLFHHLRSRDADLGAVAGRIYSWNTVGSLIGALLGGYALLFWLDLHEVYRVAVLFLVLAAVLLTLALYRIPPLLGGAAMLVPCLVVLLLLEDWQPKRLSLGLFRQRRAVESTYQGVEAAVKERRGKVEVAYYNDDPTQSVAVLERMDQPGRTVRVILNNGKPDGSTVVDYTTTAMLALVPALLTDDASRSFVIGFGTGITVGELAALEESREVVVAEISPGVLEAAPLFDFANLQASQSPKVRLVRRDAFRALLRGTEKFGVIVSEPSNPWVTGVEMLYSREFLETARDRLTPGGVYAQWFHEYETDSESMGLVLRTYAEVFDRVSVWYTLGSDLLLIGRKAGPPTDLERLERRAARADFKAGLERSDVHGFAALLAHEILPDGVFHAAHFAGPIHTLYHPLLNDRAGRGFFLGGNARLPFTGFGAAREIGARSSLVRRFAARRGGQLPDAVRRQIVLETCKYRGTLCASLLAEWRRDAPGSAVLGDVLAAARKRVNPVAMGIDEASLSVLGPLFRSDPGPVPVGNARRASQRFVAYYHHAAPFDPNALLGIWSRCKPSPQAPRACQIGLNNAQVILARGEDAFSKTNPKSN